MLFNDKNKVLPLILGSVLSSLGPRQEQSNFPQMMNMLLQMRMQKEQSAKEDERWQKGYEMRKAEHDMRMQDAQLKEQQAKRQQEFILGREAQWKEGESMGPPTAQGEMGANPYDYQPPAPGLVDMLGPGQQHLRPLMESGIPGLQNMGLKQYMQSQGQADTPMDVRTAQWYLRASPEERSAFDRTKRAQQYLNLGHEFYNPATEQNFEKGLAPEDTPRHKYDIEYATNQAKIDTAKTLAEARGEVTPKDKKRAAQGRVTVTLNEAANLYRKLDKIGGVINTDKPAVSNILARVRSSDISQSFQNTVGMSEQSVRNQINQLRPTLINHIRQASEMGARGLDSEKELEFYLQAATDTKRDIQANMAALDILNKNYGLGMGEFGVSPDQAKKLKEEFESTKEEKKIKFLGFE